MTHARGLDGERLAFGGDSAGGSLSLGAALKLRDAGEPGVVKAILSLYRSFSPDCSSAALQRSGTPADMPSGEEVREFWNLYIPHRTTTRDPHAALLLADLRGLPPTHVQVGECDVACGQNLHMAGALPAAGVRATQSRLPKRSPKKSPLFHVGRSAASPTIRPMRALSIASRAASPYWIGRSGWSQGWW